MNAHNGRKRKLPLWVMLFASTQFIRATPIQTLAQAALVAGSNAAPLRSLDPPFHFDRITMS